MYTVEEVKRSPHIFLQLGLQGKLYLYTLPKLQASHQIDLIFLTPVLHMLALSRHPDRPALKTVCETTIDAETKYFTRQPQFSVSVLAFTNA